MLDDVCADRGVLGVAEIEGSCTRDVEVALQGEVRWSLEDVQVALEFPFFGVEARSVCEHVQADLVGSSPFFGVGAVFSCTEAPCVDLEDSFPFLKGGG